MGRKIPGRKHRGVRDPEKQAAVRFNLIKDKINAPPINPEDQQIPKSLQRVIDLKTKAKNGEFNVKRKKKSKTLPEEPASIKDNRKYKGKSEKAIPVFTQLPGETDRAFLNRVNRICQDVTKEAAFEDKYGVEIIRNEAGEVEKVAKRPKDELELLIKKAKKEKQDKKDKKTKKKKKKVDENVPKLTKSQKWQKKKNEKKLKKKLENANEFDNYKDKVKFGEIVHAPPTLVAPKKAGTQKNVPRPGKKNLLLKTMLEKKGTILQKSVVGKTEEKLHKTNNKTIDKKGRRKDLPNALRRQLDKQQKDIITAYKVLKAKKYVTR